MPHRRRRQQQGLERVLGTPALFSTAYGNVGSSIYYALGVTAGDRARADAARLPDQRAHLRGDGRDLRRGNRSLPGGRRLGELRPACLQRARLVRGRLGADAQLHHHGRHLGVLRPALPVDLLGAAADEPVGHHRRRGGDPDPGRDQHRRDQGGRPAERLPRGHRLRDPAAARDHRLRDRLPPARPDRERPLGRRADLGERSRSRSRWR